MAFCGSAAGLLAAAAGQLLLEAFLNRCWGGYRGCLGQFWGLHVDQNLAYISHSTPLHSRKAEKEIDLWLSDVVK